jgi:hypothetical protein
MKNLTAEAAENAPFILWTSFEEGPEKECFSQKDKRTTDR